MHASRPALASLAALALSACTHVAGPDYVLPPQSVAAEPRAGQPFASAAAAGAVDTPLPDRWWELYQDKRLDALVEEALSANADLRAADANLRRAAAITRETTTQRMVSTTPSADISLDRASATGYHLPGILGYNVAFGASLPLDLSGKIARGIEASQADEESVRAARDDVRVAVAAGVTRTYAAVCAVNQSLAARRRVIGLQQSTLQATVRLQRGGRGTAFDVTRARAAVSESEAALPSLEAQRRTGLMLLATLMGRLPTDYPADVADCAAIPALAAPIPVGDGAALIRRRPDLRAAERVLAADTARIGVVTADLYPQVSLGGSIGLGGPAKNIGGGSSFGFSLGPLISWSFPNRRLVHARIDAAGAQADADLATFDGRVLDALRETESALTVYAGARRQVAALERARDDARMASGQADRLYRFGRSDFLQVLDAQRSLASAEATLAGARAALIDNQIDVFLALGGGWQAGS